MKRLLLLLLMTISCSQMEQQDIHITSIRKIRSGEIGEDKNLTSNYLAIEFTTNEDFNRDNDQLRFGLTCVKNVKDFNKMENIDEENGEIVFDIVDLKKQDEKHYIFYTKNHTIYNDCLCRFERPGFVGSTGYKSKIFRIKYSE